MSPAVTARRPISIRSPRWSISAPATPPTALGSLTETRQLLFAALLMADDIKEMRAGAGIPEPPPPPPDPAVAQALERLAARMEALADSLENEGASALDRQLTGTARYEL